MKRRKRKRLMFTSILVIILSIAGIAVILATRDFELKGEADVVVNIGDEYKDEGTNMRCKTKGKVDTSKAGDYVITYTKGDKTLKRTVHVVDSSNLVVGLNGSKNTIVLEGDPYIESGAYGINKLKGPVKKYKTSGEVDTKKPGDYEITYTFSSDHMKKKIKRNVKVVSKGDFEKNTGGIPVLMYHHVYTKNNKPPKIDANYILDTDLKAQLKYLKDNDYYFPSFKELRAYVDGKISLPKKSVIVTFDDGSYFFLSYGIPVINEMKVPATSFIIGSKEGEKKVKYYASSYVAFESHSYDMHKPGGNIGHGGVISSLSQAQIAADLKKNADLVGANNAFAYPFGDITDNGKKAVAERKIPCAFSTVHGLVSKGDDPRALQRIRVNGGNSLNSWIASLS